MLSSIREWIEDHKTISLVAALVFSIFLLFICYKIGSSVNGKDTKIFYLSQFQPEEVTETDFPYQYLNHFDLDENDDDAILVDLNEYEDEQYRILEGGVYKISGAMNGCLYIKAKDETIHLILDGVDIESYDGPALIVDDAERVIITLAAGSSNKLSDSGRYKEMDEYESCIQSNAPLTFNGTGYLDVYGLYKDGIKSKDTVKILESDISVHSKRTAIHGTDGIYVASGEIFIASEKNGFKTTKNGLNNRGALMILGGEITVIAGRYSFVSEAPIYILNCVVHENSTARFNVNNIEYVDEECFDE